MSALVKISEATSLAMHTMVFLASRNSRRFSNREIASRLKVSSAHLSKVLQRLVKSGLLHSSRGPAGGFRLSRPADETSLLDIFEAIEGPQTLSSCRLPHPVCQGDACVLGTLLQEVDKRALDYLNTTRLSEYKDLI